MLSDRSMMNPSSVVELLCHVRTTRPGGWNSPMRFVGVLRGAEWETTVPPVPPAPPAPVEVLNRLNAMTAYVYVIPSTTVESVYVRQFRDTVSSGVNTDCVEANFRDSSLWSIRPP